MTTTFKILFFISVSSLLQFSVHAETEKEKSACNKVIETMKSKECDGSPKFCNFWYYKGPSDKEGWLWSSTPCQDRLRKAMREHCIGQSSQGMQRLCNFTASVENINNQSLCQNDDEDSSHCKDLKVNDSENKKKCVECTYSPKKSDNVSAE